MTLKTRNRITFFLFLFSIVLLILNILFFIHCFFVHPVPFYIFSENLLKGIFLEYQPGVIYLSLFFMNLYVVITSKCIRDAFVKTQCSEICFFLCFLTACLTESLRLYIPLVALDNQFSNTLIILGKISIFSRILAPLSLLFSVIMAGPEQRQNLEQNMLIIFFVSLMIAMILPLNTGIIEKDFRVHAGFNKIIVTFEIIFHSISVIILFINNKCERYNQKTTIGMAMIIAAFVLSINSYNMIILLVSLGFYIAGTMFYLKDLHNRYLFD